MKEEIKICKPMMLLPPAKDKCQECAVDHEPENPHDATSMYYGVKFKMEKDRSPTWEDAMEHCSEEVKVFWRAELLKLGIQSDSVFVRGKL